MAKTLIIYGSTMGNTEQVAQLIAQTLDQEVEVVNVTDVTLDAIKAADRVLLGSSTWGDGELQDDFEAFIDQIKAPLLEGKDVAIFGCGDSLSYPDEFCSATDILKEKAQDAGATIISDNLRVDGEPDDHEDEIVAWAEAL